MLYIMTAAAAAAAIINAPPLPITTVSATVSATGRSVVAIVEIERPDSVLLHQIIRAALSRQRPKVL